MKTHHIREDKSCLNCGAEVPGRYCTVCGQENIVPHETFGHLVKHFIADIVHYDTKSWLTFKYLFTRPGFLTKAYIAGKRVSYVNPIRLYFFATFVYFLLYFALDAIHRQPDDKEETAKEMPADPSKRGPGDYRSRAQYDSLQALLPAPQRDDYFKRKMNYLYFKTVSASTAEEERESARELVNHNSSKILFVLLPLFALYLKWFYRKGKRWYYADHAIFAIHLHVFFFALYLLCTALDKLFHTFTFAPLGIAGTFIYLILAMKNVYGGSYGRTILKATGLTVAYLLTFLLCFFAYAFLIALIIT